MTLLDAEAAARRRCGECSLCCTLLRVDAIGKLGGIDCVHQQKERGCGIHAERPGVCRAYRCLWLRGGLEDADRPDRLGALPDLVNAGGGVRLELREARPGAFDASARLQAIAETFRESLPVRILDAGDVLDPDRPVRVLLPDGSEQRVRGERVEVWRAGSRVSERRLPWVDRLARRLALGLRGVRLRRLTRRDAAFRARTGAPR